MCNIYKYVKILFVDEVGVFVFDVGLYFFRVGYVGEDCFKVVLLYMVLGVLYCIRCLFYLCVLNFIYRIIMCFFFILKFIFICFIIFFDF